MSNISTDYSTSSTDTVPVLHYGIPLKGIDPPVTVYIHRAMRTIKQHSIEGNIMIMTIIIQLSTTLVHSRSVAIGFEASAIPTKGNYTV